MNPTPRILAVDDEPHHLELLADILGEDCETLLAHDGHQALRIARDTLPDLILLDVAMPGMNGFDVCRRLKELDATRHIPVIFLTGFGEIDDETQGLNLGAVDYVTKPLNPPSIRARVRNQIRFQLAQRDMRRLIDSEHRLQLEAERRRSEELERSKREELKLRDDFLSRVSHELRTPLTAIHGFCTLLSDGLAGKVAPEQKRLLAIVLKNVHHLQSMIEDLLQSTQAEAGKLSLTLARVPPWSAVEFAAHTLEPAAIAKGVRLGIASPTPLPLVAADPNRLRQILVILLDNAIKFTPRGGQVHVSATQNGPSVLFEVADTGCGIDPAHRARVFEHLFQVSASDQSGRTGLGLGLSIARDLVERHQGQIWVESELHRGSRFRFTIPTAPN